MTVSVVSNQDLFNYPADGYGHGVNTVGVMGAGIAVEFKKRYPDMYKYYRSRCQKGTLRGGEVIPWKTYGKNPRYVFNMATQIKPGPNASYDLVKVSFTHLNGFVEMIRKMNPAEGFNTLAIPMIGCGIGGLKSDKVIEIIDQTVAESYQVTVCVI